MMTAVVEDIRVPRSGKGRPRTRPDRVRADKGYPSKANRAWLRDRGIAATIPNATTRCRAVARSRAGRSTSATIGRPATAAGTSSSAAQSAQAVARYRVVLRQDRPQLSGGDHLAATLVWIRTDLISTD
jgi:IS5 family transposase